MNDYAATKGTFSDFKLIKGRKVAQIVIEVPIEGADESLRALGGIPQPHETRWVALALLNTVKADASTLLETARREIQNLTNILPDTVASKPKREMTLANRIGVLCHNKSFQNYLTKSPHFKEYLSSKDATPVEPEELAAGFVRFYCGVSFRSEIIPGTREGEKWRRINDGYEQWREK